MQTRTRTTLTKNKNNRSNKNSKSKKNKINCNQNSPPPCSTNQIINNNKKNSSSINPSTTRSPKRTSQRRRSEHKQVNDWSNADWLGVIGKKGTMFHWPFLFDWFSLPALSNCQHHLQTSTSECQEVPGFSFLWIPFPTDRRLNKHNNKVTATLVSKKELSMH